MPACGLCLSEGGPSSLCLNSCLCGKGCLCGQSHRRPWSPTRSKPRAPKPPVLLPRPPGGDNRTSKPPQGPGPGTAASGPERGGSRSAVVTREPGVGRAPGPTKPRPGSPGRHHPWCRSSTLRTAAPRVSFLPRSSGETK